MPGGRGAFCTATEASSRPSCTAIHRSRNFWYVSQNNHTNRQIQATKSPKMFAKTGVDSLSPTKRFRTRSIGRAMTRLVTQSAMKNATATAKYGHNRMPSCLSRIAKTPIQKKVPNTPKAARCSETTSHACSDSASIQLPPWSVSEAPH